jgi:hypothetical protein
MAPQTNYEALELEIAGERAASLGRAGRRLEAALAAVAVHTGSAEEREELLAEAGEVLWFYVIQRECLRMFDHDNAFAIYRVPGDVLARMGPRRRRG